MVEEDEQDWGPIAVVGSELGVALRTLYAWARAGKVPKRRREGITFVPRSAVRSMTDARVHAAATQQQGTLHTHQAPTNGSAPAPGDDPDVAAARSRIELLKLAAEEERLTHEQAMARAARKREAEDFAFEHQRRLRQLEIEADRERLELEREAWQLGVDRRKAEEQAAAEQRARSKDVERRRAQEAQERQRRGWELEWERAVAVYIRKNLGEAALAPGLAIARGYLARLDPSQTDEFIERGLVDELAAGLADDWQRVRTERQMAARRELVDQVVLWACLFASDEARAAAWKAADGVAAQIDPLLPEAREQVAAAARRARAAAEADAAERAASRRREEAQAAEDERWRRYRTYTINALARSWLHEGASNNERAALRDELIRLLDQKPAWMTPVDFEKDAKHQLREQLEMVERRVRIDQVLRRVPRGLDAELRKVAENAYTSAWGDGFRRAQVAESAVRKALAATRDG